MEVFWLTLTATVIILVALNVRRTPGISEIRLRALERKVDSIVQHLGVEVPKVGCSDEVRELLRRGKKIEAIKAWRAETGSGLAEAKEAVEAIQREMGAGKG